MGFKREAYFGESINIYAKVYYLAKERKMHNEERGKQKFKGI